jgi:hypothetical protein
MANVIDIDRGWKRIVKQMSEINHSFVKVGLLGKSGNHKGSKATIVDIGTFNEYGARIPVTAKMRAWFAYQGVFLRKDTTEIVIPPRPFMKKTFDDNQDQVKSISDNLKGQIFAGQISVQGALKKMGVWYQGQIWKTFEKNNFKPNSPLTVLWKTKNGKSGDTPLINTGQMRQSINFEIGKELNA